MRKIGMFIAVVMGAVLWWPPSGLGQTKEEILAVHEAMKQALNAQNVDGVMAVWADDCVFDYVALPQPLVGKEQIRQFFADLFRGFPDFHVEQRQILVSGNIVVTECTTTGTHLGEWMGLPATGSKGAPDIHMDIYEFEGTKIKKITTYLDVASIMMNLGLMPIPELPAFVPSFTLPAPEPLGLAPLEAGAEHVRRWNTHDLTLYAKGIRADAEFLVAALGVPMDRAAFIASQEMFFAAFQDLSVEVPRRLDMGDGWLVEDHIYTATHKAPYMGIPATGRSIRVKGVTVTRLDSTGSIAYMSSYWDQITLLTQLGAVQPPKAPPIYTSHSENWEPYK